MIAQLAFSLAYSLTTTVGHDRCPAFYVSSIKEGKALTTYFNDGHNNVTSATGHMVDVTFSHSRIMLDGDDDIHGCVASVKLPAGVITGTTISAEAGIDPALSGMVDLGDPNQWVHFDVGTIPTGGASTCDISFQYIDSGSNKLLGTLAHNGPLRVIYREKHDHGTVDWYIWDANLNTEQVLDNPGSGSVDSRLIYGTANGPISGPPNANGTLRNLIFNPYQFRGGMFVGNMPPTTGDLSGASRMQVWLGQPTGGNIEFVALSLAHLGPPPKPASGGGLGCEGGGGPPPDIAKSITIRAALGSTTETPSTSKWSNRMSVGDTLSTFTLPDWNYDSPDQDYASWNLCSATSTSVTIPTGILGTGSTYGNVVLLADNEDSLIDGHVQRWRYFASDEYSALTWSTFQLPKSDSKPRAWLLELTNTVTITGSVP